MKVSTILDQIDLGSMALPEFQRGYVWNREQVRGLMQSLYRKYPIGSLLIWVTQTSSANARGDAELNPGSVKLLLDGQQRITTLYGAIRGTPPPFFDGNAQAFAGLHFHLEEETFEFYMPTKMKDNPLWIDVTKLMQEGAGKAIARLYQHPDMHDRIETYINRLSSIDAIKNVDLHNEEVAGEDKTVDVVVDIFNRVNSGGTKLSKGDLALAKVCASWPAARGELRQRLDKWRGAGFDFKMDWLLRNINTIVTGEALFSALRDVDTGEFRDGLEAAEKTVDTLLNLISYRLGLDHDRVLGGRYAFPVMSRYLHTNGGGKPKDHRERDKLLYWYVHTLLWGRYTGSTESVINQDLDLIEEKDGALDRLIDQLRQNRGDLRLQPGDFAGWSRGARFYPLLYLLTRTWGAKDWGTGNDIKQETLGKLSALQLHHIFPRNYLYKHGYSMSEVNALANFTFLTQETNLEISDRAPEAYFEEIAEKHPGALESQWIPIDRDLWKVENYRDFLAARRKLLADAANDFLDQLLHGEVPETEPQQDITESAPVTIAPSSPDEEEQTLELLEWLSERYLPDPELEYELADENTGEPLAILDMAWPEGIQPGFSQPVAVLLGEPREVEQAANQAGYLFFTSVEDFKAHVETEILIEPDEDAIAS